MSTPIIDYYILFPNHMEGLRLQKELASAGIKCVIAPTPREASNFCGMSLRINSDSIDKAKDIIHQKAVKIAGIFSIPRPIQPVFRSC